MSKQVDLKTKLEIVQTYENNKKTTATDLSKQYKLNLSTILKILRKYDIKIRPKKLFLDEVSIVEKYNSGVSASDIAKEYDVSNTTIGNILDRNNVKKRTPHEIQLKYPYNKNFFDEIDTQEKAYVLGLLFADGCNSENTNAICIQLADLTTVQQVANAIEINRPIRYAAPATKNHSPKYALNIHGKYISEQLAKHGCVQAKTHILKFPTTVPNYLMHHFIRGYFDGDGCIHLRKNSNNKVIHIISTEQFCKKMQKVLPVASFVHQRTGKTVWFLGIYKNQDVMKFHDWLYQDATIFMERKKELFGKKDDFDSSFYKDIIAETKNFIENRNITFDKWLVPSKISSLYNELPENKIEFDEEEYIKNETILDKIKYISIGNPLPKFSTRVFNKCAKYSEIIAFVVPKKFKNAKLINSNINKNFFLEFEKEISNKFTNEPIIFQIWMKKKEKRNDGTKTILKNENFKFVKKNQANIAIKRLGTDLGKVFSNLENCSPESHYFIETSEVNTFEKISWDDKKGACISKNDVISRFMETSQDDNSFYMERIHKS